MKAVKSKAQERKEIEFQINRYLKKGGEVDLIDTGVSGRPIGTYPATPIAFDKSRESRTLLLDEVKAIESRKAKPSTQSSSKTKTPTQPKKVLITDDFGEPLRWSWQDS